MFQSVSDFLESKIFRKLHGSIEMLQRLKQGLNLCFSIFKRNELLPVK